MTISSLLLTVLVQYTVTVITLSVEHLASDTSVGRITSSHISLHSNHGQSVDKGPRMETPCLSQLPGAPSH